MTQFPRHALDDMVLSELRTALNSTRCMLVEGPRALADGASGDEPPVPLWPDHIKLMAEWCRRRGLQPSSFAAEITRLVDSGCLREAGLELEGVLTDADTRKLCVQETGTGNWAPMRALHRDVVQAGFGTYISLSYDLGLQQALDADSGAPVHKVYENSALGDALTSFQQEDTPFLLKLQGDVDDGRTIRLGDPTFDRLVPDLNTTIGDGAADCRTVLHNLVATCPVLFLGFAGVAYELDGLLTKIPAFRGRQHHRWVAVPEGQCPPLRAKRLWQDFGVSVLEYGRKDLPLFVRSLATEPHNPPTRIQNGPAAREQAGPARTMKVFISYSHFDDTFRNLLDNHLFGLKMEGTITVWHDRKILGGEDWNTEISEQLQSADLVILLVSSSFFGSRYCTGIELRSALQRRNNGECEVVNILVRDVDVKGTPLEVMQILPRDQQGVWRAVEQWESPDNGMATVARELRKLIEERLNRN